ncbi:DUF1259 domain-containing protein [Brevibacillus sp. B_LB10_24]|uniref:DUF1259 domain-containing protein n=1 Tax=Brevibacillus sp. B_LB10_24 TaxID=3380645 RepID=UPI0038BBF760
MKISKQLCSRLARILGGKGMSNDTCSIMIKRNLHAKILGRNYDTEHEIVIQSPDKQGRTLNTGEITVLQREVNRFVDAARKQGFKVTAIHNHWLFEKPRLMYVHIEVVENPVTFAKRLRKALNVLK